MKREKGRVLAHISVAATAQTAAFGRRTNAVDWEGGSVLLLARLAARGRHGESTGSLGFAGRETTKQGPTAAKGSAAIGESGLTARRDNLDNLRSLRGWTPFVPKLDWCCRSASLSSNVQDSSGPKRKALSQRGVICRQVAGLSRPRLNALAVLKRARGRLSRRSCDEMHADAGVVVRAAPRT